jgi:hypothetical protein
MHRSGHKPGQKEEKKMSKPRITFLNDNEERTIAELGENALENTQNALETLLNAEGYETEALGRLYDYALELYPVPYNEDEGGKIEYYCYLISYGGPSEEVRFYPHRTEFVYLGWYSGIGFDVSGDEVFQQLRSFLDDRGLLDFKAEV